MVGSGFREKGEPMRLSFGLGAWAILNPKPKCLGSACGFKEFPGKSVLLFEWVLNLKPS